LAEKLSRDKIRLLENMELWLALLEKNLSGEKKLFSFEPAKNLFLMDELEKSLVRMRETSSNSRIVLENFFLKF
jgi:hypothetical protein